MATDLNTAGMKTASTAKMPAHKRMSPTTSMSDLYSSDSVEIVATPDIAPPPHKTLAEMLEPRLWSMLVLAGLAVSFPLVATCTAIVTLLQRLFGASPKTVPSNGKTAIVSGGKMTKSYVLIKQLKAQGCRVVLVETNKYWMVASRFSNCVDRFVTVPVPEKEPEAYVAAMVRLAEEEKADVFVPVTSPVASAYEARLNAALPAHCFSWSLPPDEVEALDDKVIYCRSAESLGLPVSVAHRVSSHAEVVAWNEKFAALAAAEPDAKHPRYIFKNLQYDSMHRLDLFTLPCAPAKLEAYLADPTITLNADNQWTVQTFIVGDEYSTCAICKDGKLLAFTDNAACLSCFNYVPARNDKLREWVATFVAARNLSGVACFDFIIGDDGVPYSIECNPRASSNIANFYNHKGLGAVLANPESNLFDKTIEPLPGVVETYWLFAEVIDALFHKKDAYYDPRDPLPSLAQLYVHLPTLLARNIYTGNKWAKIDPCIGKMTEENGD